MGKYFKEYLWYMAMEHVKRLKSTRFVNLRMLTSDILLCIMIRAMHYNLGAVEKGKKE